MGSLWKSFKEWTGASDQVNRNKELNKSGYFLVSCGEFIEDTLQHWLGLPDEVRNDPDLAPFKQCYEEQGTLQSISVIQHNGMEENEESSAPVLLEEVAFCNTNKYDVTEEETIEKTDINENQPTVKIEKNNKARKAKFYTKMTILLACWVFFTVIFMTYDEKKEVTTISFVAPDEVKTMIPVNLNPTSCSTVAIAVKLSGPFLSEHSQIKLGPTEKETRHKMEVWMERSTGNNGTIINIEKSETWTIILQNDTKLDFNEGEQRTSILRFSVNSTDSNVYTYALRMRTTSTQTTPFVISYKTNPLDNSTGVIYACILLAGLYLLIIFEVINRTMAAITVSTMSLAALALAGERPSLPEVISWLDEETLLLLFSMMILVAIMAETGIFDFLAVFTFEVTKGKLWPLIYLLCAITAILSTFLDNVTTVLLMSPVTIRLCKVMKLDPVPILMFMAIYSNIGGTATPVGDPPNVIVASNKAVIQAGINFTNFTAHMSLGIFLVFIQTSLQMKYIYRDFNKLRRPVPKEIQDLIHQISIWGGAGDSLPNLSKDVRVVTEKLKRKIIAKLKSMLKERSKRACPKDTFQSTLAELKKKHKIRDKVLLVKCLVAIAFVVIVFFLHAIPDVNRVSLGLTALLGVILLLTLADREDLKLILEKVEWSTLLFFAALFVLMEALSKLGLIIYIGGMMEQVILMVGESVRLAVALMLILWVSGVISAFIDNVPLTTMMVRVVVTIGSNPHLNLPMAPLIWALLFGACLGGNGTLIGASANVVCAGEAEKYGYPITFSRFFKVGFPVMIGHLVVASVYLLICHCVFTWH